MQLSYMGGMGGGGAGGQGQGEDDNRISDRQKEIIAATWNELRGKRDRGTAAENARFGDTHIRVGLVAGDGGAVIWPLLVGVAKAKELLFTGDLIDAREAERIGLINRVVPAGKAYDEAFALAKRLAAGPTRALRWTKLAANKRLKDEVNLVLDASLAVETLSFATEDHKEAARAFVEKRAPKFTGR